MDHPGSRNGSEATIHSHGAVSRGGPVLRKWSVLMTTQLRADARRKARELGLWGGATDAELARFCFAYVAGYEAPLETARVRGGRPVTHQADA